MTSLLVGGKKCVGPILANQPRRFKEQDTDGGGQDNVKEDSDDGGTYKQ